MGTRYLLPANRGGGSGQTYVRWDSSAGLDASVFTDLSTSFRIQHRRLGRVLRGQHAEPRHLQHGRCRRPLPTIRSCSTGPALSPGASSTRTTSSPDCVFSGGRGTAWHTDRELRAAGTDPRHLQEQPHRRPATARNLNQDCVGRGTGLRPTAGRAAPAPGTGTCTANTFCSAPGPAGPPSRQPFSCCVNAGTGTCGDPCAASTPIPTPPECRPIAAISPPTVRASRSVGGPRPVRRGRVEPRADQRLAPRLLRRGPSTILRGTPNAGCSILPRFDYNGDPGPDCGVLNYGIDPRDDDNCDGVADFPDLCPRNSEWNQTLDSDGDCGTPGSRAIRDDCRGDECECGDQDGTAGCLRYLRGRRTAWSTSRTSSASTSRSSARLRACGCATPTAIRPAT